MFKTLKTLSYKRLENLLCGVEKPGRYIGHEFGTGSKSLEYISGNENMVLAALAFPDVYEVGMSNLGIQILYEIINKNPGFSAERVFAPWNDFEDRLRSEKVKLFSLESRLFLDSFDLIGFNAAHEMLYTNILNMLDLSGIDIRSQNRRSNVFPLVCSGGSSCVNPWPLSKFMDFLVIGDGEDVIVKILNEIKDFKVSLKDALRKNMGTVNRKLLKKELLKKISKIEGIFVPEFYKIIYKPDSTVKKIRALGNDIKKLPVRKASVKDLNSYSNVITRIIPNIRTVHDRLNIEIMRGCSRGCRFCQAGFIYRPLRNRKVKDLIQQSVRGLKASGYDEISFTSLSSSDYRQLPELINSVISQIDFERISISLPSMRLDSFNVDIMEKLMSGRKTGLTFAPEAGSQRLRDIIKKDLTEQNLLDSIGIALSKGWVKIKLYFMVGLPGERDEDIDAITELLNKIIDKARIILSGKDFSRFQISVSINAFSPKPFTPMQWACQDSIESINKKISRINSSIPKKYVKLNWTSPSKSRIECVLSRGDTRVSDVIEYAFRSGAKFDNWTDKFNYDLWIKSFNELDVDHGFYSEREYGINEILPWDAVDIGISKSYYTREYGILKIKKDQLR